VLLSGARLVQYTFLRVREENTLLIYYYDPAGAAATGAAP
jgi:hypothetical protein